MRIIIKAGAQASPDAQIYIYIYSNIKLQQKHNNNNNNNNNYNRSFRVSHRQHQYADTLLEYGFDPQLGGKKYPF